MIIIVGGRMSSLLCHLLFLLVFHAILLLLLDDHSSVHAFSSSNKNNNNNPHQRQNLETTTTKSSTESRLLVLPIFPLRKTVRLPTELLTLNLYEERYLKLAEYVLSLSSQNNNTPYLCGALYASDQPQMIKGGGRSSPIVPMVTPGQVGVVCWVHQHSADDIPTVGGKAVRPRIRLELVALQRFEITKVLHNGFGGGCAVVADDEGENNETPLPFILAETKLIHDDDTNNNNSSQDDASSFQLPPLLQQYKDQHQHQPPESVALRLPSDAELHGFQRAALQIPQAASQRRLACLQGRSSAERLQQFGFERWRWRW